MIQPLSTFSNSRVLTTSLTARSLLPTVGLELAFEMFDPASVVMSGGKISRVNDKSGHARHANGLFFGSRPMAGTAANGKGVAQFNAASSTNLTASVGTAFDVGTVMVLGWSTNAGTPAAEGFICIDKASNVEPSPSFAFYATSATTQPVKAGRTTTADSGTMTDFAVVGGSRATTFNLYTMRQNVALPSMELLVGKTTTPTATDTAVSSTTLYPTDGNFIIGADYQNAVAGNYLTGEIQAVYVWSRYLSDTELLSMHAYLVGFGLL